MSFLDKKFARDYAHNYSAERNRAEDAADAQQDAVAPVAHNEFELAIIKAEEERRILRNFPIGTTMESARRKGWVS